MARLWDITLEKEDVKLKRTFFVHYEDVIKQKMLIKPVERGQHGGGADGLESYQEALFFHRKG